MFLKRAHITRIESELKKSILAMKMHQNGNSPSENNVTPLFIVGFSAADLISRDCIWLTGNSLMLWLLIWMSRAVHTQRILSSYGILIAFLLALRLLMLRRHSAEYYRYTGNVFDLAQ